MEDDLKWKRTSNGSRPQIEDDLKWKTTSNGRQPPIEDDRQWKMTSKQRIPNGRQPPMEVDSQLKKTSNARRPKISKVEYLSNHRLDLPQILNPSLGGQSKINLLEMKTTSNGRRPQRYTQNISKLNISATTKRIFLKF